MEKSDADSPNETLKELVAEIHHLQQLVREKDLQIKRNEVSHSFLVKSLFPMMVQCILIFNSIYRQQNDTSVQKINRLEKQIEHEKRLNGNLSAEIHKLNEEALRCEQSSYSLSKEQHEQVIYNE